jgi:hypothetical protein
VYPYTSSPFVDAPPAAVVAAQAASAAASCTAASGSTNGTSQSQTQACSTAGAGSDSKMAVGVGVGVGMGVGIPLLILLGSIAFVLMSRRNQPAVNFHMARNGAVYPVTGPKVEEPYSIELSEARSPLPRLSELEAR